MAGIDATAIAFFGWKNLPFIVPVLVGVLVIILDRRVSEDDKDVFVWAAAFVSAVSIILFSRAWLSDEVASFMGLDVSRFSIFGLIIIMAVSFLMLLSAIDCFHPPSKSPSDFISCFLFTIFGLQAALSTKNLIVVFLGFFAASNFLSLILKTYKGGSAARKFWIYSVLADVIFVAGCVFYFGSTGSFTVLGRAALMDAVGAAGGISYFVVGIAFILASLFMKIGVVPLHWWILDMSRVKHLSIINLFTIIYRGAVFFVLLKLLAPIASVLDDHFRILFVVVSILTMSCANIAGIRSKDLRELISYSSIAYGGYLIAVFQAVSPMPLDAGISFIFLTAVFLFAHAGALFSVEMDKSGSGDHRWHKIFLAVFMFSIAGIPPLFGFISRFMLFGVLASSGDYLLIVAIAVNFVIHAYYCLRAVLSPSFACQESTPSPVEWLCRKGDGGVAYPLIIAAGAAALLALYLGLTPSTFIDWIWRSIVG